MMLLLVTDPRGVNHLTGRHHPERPQRLDALMTAATSPELVDRITVVEPISADRSALERVHTPEMVTRLERLRGRSAEIDADTVVSPDSIDVAYLAAGAGLTAIDQLEATGARAAFCAMRPPGHHATRQRAMGFCLFNNVAVAAAELVSRGERVLIADFDAHHGNGTQDIFWNNPSVLFVSWHQSPLYPGTGRVDERGGTDAVGRTLNLTMNAGSTGELYLESMERVVNDAVTDFAPTWLLISAGFDAHRDDPLTELGLTAGDFNRLTLELCAYVPVGRVIAFLEGGYDLAAVQRSSAATMEGLLGESVHSEAPSSGGGSHEAFDAMCAAHLRGRS